MKKAIVLLAIGAVVLSGFLMTITPPNAEAGLIPDMEKYKYYPDENDPDCWCGGWLIEGHIWSVYWCCDGPREYMPPGVG